MPKAFVLSFAVLAACGAHSSPSNRAATEDSTVTSKPAALEYPVTRKGDVVDDYHGTRVADPYRWLEDPDSDETARWVEAQNAVTFSFLDSYPKRDQVHRRMTDLWNYQRYGLPGRRADRYFWAKNDGLQNQSVYYWARSLDQEPVVLFDPNTWSKDGTVALSSMAVSEDAKLVAYGVQASGSDWNTWKVRDIDSGADLSDELRWSKFSDAEWTHDNKGFFYGRYPEPPAGGAAFTDTNENQKLYYHRVGTSQAEDLLIFANPDEPKWGYGASVTEDGRYLIVTVWKGTGNDVRIFYRDLQAHPPGVNDEAAMVPLIDRFEAMYSLIGSEGSVVWFHTDLDAPRGRVIAIDLRKPDRENWRTLVPQGEDVIQSVSEVGGRLFVEYLHHARSRIAVHDLDGRALGDVELPGLGSVAGFGGRRDHTETFYSFTSYNTPTAIYRYDIASGKSTVWKAPVLAFEGSRFVTEQVFATSKDGTRVPMFVTRAKDTALDGNNPTILYGYGGFNISLTPAFSPTIATWLDMGGVYVVANLRGGSEYGETWHKAGTVLQKQNVFDDFYACAEWLIANRYTRSEKLAIQGRSNGGLLVGAAMTQRPELFGAALPGVGVLDMLRFHTFTIGWAWVDDYGSAEDPDQFKALYAYSPLHNVEPGTRYPATLIITADHDDRVVPAHSFKFAAALQAAQAGPAPVLIRIQTKAGHGAGVPTSIKIAESADELAFLGAIFDM